jgi:hypothetical protein
MTDFGISSIETSDSDYRFFQPELRGRLFDQSEMFVSWVDFALYFEALNFRLFSL